MKHNTKRIPILLAAGMLPLGVLLSSCDKQDMRQAASEAKADRARAEADAGQAAAEAKASLQDAGQSAKEAGREAKQETQEAELFS